MTNSDNTLRNASSPFQTRIEQLTKNTLWLAPLAGFTDYAFRMVCKDQGADVIVSEMVSADGLAYDSDKTLVYMRFNEAQRPFGIQLFGNVPAIMARAAQRAAQENPDFIDINMGCPVKKVIGRQAGCGLMREPKIAYDIVKAVKEVLAPLQIPLTVKFRSGWDQHSINYLEYGPLMEEAGADIICLHPRTRSQQFEGKSNWTHIKNLVQVVTVPVIGNGDIRTPDDANRMFEETGCAGIMIGRGALGNPWIFDEIKAIRAGKEYHRPSPIEQFEVIAKQYRLAVADKPSRAIFEMRGQLCYYTKGIPNSAKVRAQINSCADPEETLSLVKELLFLQEAVVTDVSERNTDICG